MPSDLDHRLYLAAQRRQWTVHDTILAALVHWLDQEDPRLGQEHPSREGDPV